MYKKIIKIVLVIIWMIVIFLFSSQNANKSLDTSNNVLINTVETIKKESLTNEEKEKIIDKYEVLIRKCAHFTVYFILAILVFILLKEYININYKILLYTILWCFIYAITDEIHQLYIDGRSGQILDVLIDTSGAYLSTIILYIITKRKEKRIISEK